MTNHGQGSNHREVAVSLYYAVRDSIWYDPFNIRFEEHALHPAEVLKNRKGHCVDKAVFYVTVCRGVGIPARIGLARVRNHMGTARLEAILKSDVLNPHGYAEVYINDTWVKCTPAFNKELCSKLYVAPLDFDGVNDSIFQAYDRAAGGFMTYLDDFGTFSHLPVELLRAKMFEEYPHLFHADGSFKHELLNLPKSTS